MKAWLAALVALSACKAEHTAPPDAASSSAAELPRSPIECPAGTQLRGKTPPEGNRMWCETPGGVSHGPFLSWHPEGQKKTQGRFEDGSAAGEWTSWYDNGQLRARGHYEDGTRAGEWTRFERDGAPARPRGSVTERPAPPARAIKVVTGIPACDRYLHFYQRCIETRMPEATRTQLRGVLDQTAEGWKAVSKGPGREALATTCRAAIDAIREATKSWGCEFS